MKTQIRLFDDQGLTEATPHAESVELQIRAIENSAFPFEELSKIAEQESWRKEVNRPTYHIHKWWAQRLGSVFRALALGTFSPNDANILELFYKPSRIGDVIVFDPFMGSGTTLGEVLKLGGRVVGQDINPVAHFLVKNALGLPRHEEVLNMFKQIEADTAERILKMYTAKLPGGQTGQVLYYFWVKVVDCLHCEKPVELFSSYVFAQHAYPKRNPEVRMLCPSCNAVYTGLYAAERSECPECHLNFCPANGTVTRSEANCVHCKKSFRIAKAVQKSGKPPDHRMYAKLVLTPDGKKTYLRADDFDRALYERAKIELSEKANAFPRVAIKPGYNTKQAINYCYNSWHEMFNARQLLCLSILADRIREIPEKRLRELFCCLFSGILEFNNMFSSFKGEGTGAVRHMFSHHVLKPERTPIEANVWGTLKSSGSFSTLFKSRLLRAIEYAENPFEIRAANGTATKVFDLSEPLTVDPSRERIRLNCGDSSQTSLEGDSIDAVITDPPFFDNVHYSELADFFFVWQRHVLGETGFHLPDSTRAIEEVQHADADEFETRLTSVLSECKRVLKPEGLLVFTFHHSRAEGWSSLLGSLVRAGFQVVAVHPIRSEMSGATPKHQAKEPISFDVVFVCRKLRKAEVLKISHVPSESQVVAQGQLNRLLNAGFAVSLNDVRLLVFSHAVRILSGTESGFAKVALQQIEAQLEDAANTLAKLRLKSLARSA